MQVYPYTSQAWNLESIGYFDLNSEETLKLLHSDRHPGCHGYVYIHDNIRLQGWCSKSTCVYALNVLTLYNGFSNAYYIPGALIQYTWPDFVWCTHSVCILDLIYPISSKSRAAMVSTNMEGELTWHAPSDNQELRYSTFNRPIKRYKIVGNESVVITLRRVESIMAQWTNPQMTV